MRMLVLVISCALASTGSGSGADNGHGHAVASSACITAPTDTMGTAAPCFDGRDCAIPQRKRSKETVKYHRLPCMDLRGGGASSSSSLASADRGAMGPSGPRHLKGLGHDVTGLSVCGARTKMKDLQKKTHEDLCIDADAGRHEDGDLGAHTLMHARTLTFSLTAASMCSRVHSIGVGVGILRLRGGLKGRRRKASGKRRGGYVRKRKFVPLSPRAL